MAKAVVNQTQIEAEVAQFLANACERNASALIQFEPSDGPIVTARARLLGLTERHILADKPAITGESGHIPIGRPISVHVSLNGARFQFASRIEPGRRWVQLNSRQRVPGIAMRKPIEILRAERRSSFRISLAGIDPIPIEMVRSHPDVRDACPVDARVIPGRLINISATGVAVLIACRFLQCAERRERYFLSFMLPGSEMEFCMLGSIRHVRVIKASDSFRLALSFMQWGERRFSTDEDLITRFIAEQQRRMLRRRK